MFTHKCTANAARTTIESVDCVLFDSLPISIKFLPNPPRFSCSSRPGQAVDQGDLLCYLNLTRPTMGTATQQKCSCSDIHCETCQVDRTAY
jgi:hypothetical protein